MVSGHVCWLLSVLERRFLYSYYSKRGELNKHIELIKIAGYVTAFRCPQPGSKKGIYCDIIKEKKLVQIHRKTLQKYTETKQKIARIFIALFVLGNVFPAGSFAWQNSLPVHLEANLPVRKVVVVNNRLQESKPVVALAGNSLPSAPCAMVSPLENGFVQGSAAVNLYQPANCFELVISENTNQEISLSVETFDSQVVVKVIDGSKFASHAVKESSPVKAPATAPAVSSTGSEQKYQNDLSEAELRITGVSRQIVTSKTELSELQVFRC
jgi:hypothetical protein